MVGGGCWLRIFQINDVYELENFPHFYTLVHEYDEDGDNEHEGRNDEYELPTARQQQQSKKKKRKPDKTLVVLSGDFLAPSLLSSLDKGAAMIDIMNKCGMTHVCFGNHECDVPLEALKKRIASSEFLWLNSNMQELNPVLSNLGSPVNEGSVDDDTTASSSPQQRRIETPDHDIIHVTNAQTNQTVRVGLLGLLTNEDGLYRPNSFGNATIEDIVPTTKRLLQTYSAKADFWIPLTHQSMNDDREFAKHFGCTFPLIIGGHDHTIFDEQIVGDDGSAPPSRVIKTGMDAKHTGIIDFVWGDAQDRKSSSMQPSITVDLVPTKSYPPNPEIQKCVDGHLQIISELERAKLFPILNWANHPISTSPNEESAPVVFSTRNNRLKPSIGTTVLTSMIRMGMQATVGLMNAGSIRGNATYDASAFFTWSNLKSEIPFPTNMVCVHLPGNVIEDTIKYSRQPSRQNPPIPSGGYIHTCNNIFYDDQSQCIESIDGHPLHPTQLYLTALPLQCLNGIDNLEPLLEWVENTASSSDLTIIHHPESSSVIPAKLVLVEFLSAILWLQLLGDDGSFHDLDTNGDGVLSRDEIRQSVSKLYNDPGVADLIVDNVMSIADIHGTGKVSPMDMIIVHLVATDLLSPHGHYHTTRKGSTDDDLCDKDGDDHCALKETIQKTAAKVMGKDEEDEAVATMVDRILQEHYLLHHDGDGNSKINEIENADPTTPSKELEGGGRIERRIKKTLGKLRRRSLLV